MNPISETSANLSNILGEALLRFKRDQKFFLFDFETCSLNLVHKKNVPWECAYVICNQKEIIKERSFLINWPEIPISDEAARVTGFYQKRHLIPTQGLNPLAALNEFDEHLYDESLIPVAHNGLGFDVYIHNIYRKLCGKKTDYSYIKRFIDTMVIARGMKLGATFPRNREDLISFQYKMNGNPVRGIKTSVKALTADYGIEYDETRAHDALYDVHLLRPILYKLIQEVEI